MKGIKKTFIFSVLVLLVVFSMTACNPNSNSGGKHSGDTADVYVISVDTKNVTVDTSGIKVCIYALNGSGGSLEAQLTGGKATFALDADDYIATLIGLDETVSFSSVLLTKTDRKATITLSDSEFDDLTDTYSFAFTVVMLSGEKKLDEISAQICDDSMCIPIWFSQSNVIDIRIHKGQYSVEVHDSDFHEIYNEKCIVTSDTRFYVIQL
ncbi:MAG: hypothetical protein J1G01_01485 [Clostridiales bacterium]|nr:hypothetical protein [Clostridiales bacterium]